MQACNGEQGSGWSIGGFGGTRRMGSASLPRDRTTRPLRRKLVERIRLDSHAHPPLVGNQRSGRSERCSRPAVGSAACSGATLSNALGMSWAIRMNQILASPRCAERCGDAAVRVRRRALQQSALATHLSPSVAARVTWRLTTAAQGAMHWPPRISVSILRKPWG